MAIVSAMHVAAARPENLYRSAHHVISSFGTLLLIEMVLNAHTAVLAASAFAAFAWTLEITRRVFPAWNAVIMRSLGFMAHRHETTSINSATWMGTGLALIAPFFAQPTLALAVITIGLGDPAAGFVGRRYGRHKLVNDRTLEGSLAYFVVSFLAGWAALSFWHPALGGQAMAAAAVAAVAGAVTELFCRNVDDNLAVPVIVALAVGLVLQGNASWALG
jgi:dolichol kinase